MNGMELGKGLYFGCDVYSGGGEVVDRIIHEGDTCDVTLPDGTKAVLCSDGPKEGFYIQFPIKDLTVERNYFHAAHENAFKTCSWRHCPGDLIYR